MEGRRRAHHRTATFANTNPHRSHCYDERIDHRPYCVCVAHHQQYVYRMAKRRCKSTYTIFKLRFNRFGFHCFTKRTRNVAKSVGWLSCVDLLQNRSVDFLYPELTVNQTRWRADAKHWRLILRKKSVYCLR